jgi:hypothetical protein
VRTFYERSIRSSRLGRDELKVVVAAASAAVAVLLVVVFFRRVFGVEYRALLQDPASYVDFPRYIGAVSYGGVIAWFFAACTALFAASLIGLSSARGRFLLAFGLASAWLGIDDLFLVHESVGRLITGTEAGEDAVFAAYVVGMAALLWWTRDTLASSPVLVLVASGVFFGLSIVVDRPDLYLRAHFLVEDGLKFIGIVLWGAYGWITALRFTLEHLHGPRSGETPPSMDPRPMSSASTGPAADPGPSSSGAGAPSTRAR